MLEATELLRKTLAYNINISDNDDFARNIILNFESFPGVGKTSCVTQVCKQEDYNLNIIPIASYDAGEIAGFPMLDKENKTYNRAKPFWMDTPTDKPTVFFFDEISQAPTANVNVLGMLLNERRLGEHKLADNVAIVCAGNKMAHRAGTKPLPSQFKDRVTTINIEPDLDSFLGYANSKSLHHYILGFLRNMPQNLSVFDPAAESCPSPRSWMRIDTILKMKLPYNLQCEAIKGQVGDAAQADFLAYLRVADKMEDPAEILAGKHQRVPEDSNVLYALCAALATLVTGKTSSNFVNYLSELPEKEFAAFTIRDALQRDKKLKGDKHITKWFMSEGRDLLL
jgi:hypothetical protein